VCLRAQQALLQVLTALFHATADQPPPQQGTPSASLRHLHLHLCSTAKPTVTNTAGGNSSKGLDDLATTALLHLHCAFSRTRNARSRCMTGVVQCIVIVFLLQLASHKLLSAAVHIRLTEVAQALLQPGPSLERTEPRDDACMHVAARCGLGESGPASQFSLSAVFRVRSEGHHLYVSRCVDTDEGRSALHAGRREA
jgi:hypothetical protein